jgi:hypothetical protein
MNFTFERVNAWVDWIVKKVVEPIWGLLWLALFAVAGWYLYAYATRPQPGYETERTPARLPPYATLIVHAVPIRPPNLTARRLATSRNACRYVSAWISAWKNCHPGRGRLRELAAGRLRAGWTSQGLAQRAAQADRKALRMATAGGVPSGGREMRPSDQHELGG